MGSPLVCAWVCCSRRAREGARRAANWSATASKDDGRVCAMRDGQLVMEEMRSQAGAGLPCRRWELPRSNFSETRRKAELWGGGRKHWQWLAKSGTGRSLMAWGTLRPSKVPSA